MLNVNVLSEFPSPHMMDFWEAVHVQEDVRLKLFFERPTVPTKFWGKIAEYLDAEVTDWSELTLTDKFRWTKGIFSVPADVWILCDNYRFWENHLLAFKARRKRIATVYLAERTYWKCLQSTGTKDWKNIIYPGLKKALVPFLVRSFDALACYGDWAVEQYKSIAPGKYIFPTEYYVGLNGLRKIGRPKKGPNDPINLGTCGTLIPRKGLRYIVHNLGLISRFSNWQLKIAGDGPLRGELESGIPGELRSRVEFFGHMSVNEMKGFWENIDVLLFPSLFDGWAMVVVEALTAGVPVISGPNVGAARQYIRNGYNGEIRGVNDSFLQSVLPILEYPGKLDELSVNARASVENYRPEIGAENFVKHLKILTNRI